MPNKITVIRKVTLRAGATVLSADYGTANPGFEAEYDFLQGDGLAPDGSFLPNGDVWARLTKQINDRAGKLATAFVAVRVNGTTYSQKIHVESNDSEYNRGWNDCRAATKFELPARR